MKDNDDCYGAITETRNLAFSSESVPIVWTTEHYSGSWVDTHAAVFELKICMSVWLFACQNGYKGLKLSQAKL